MKLIPNINNAPIALIVICLSLAVFSCKKAQFDTAKFQKKQNEKVRKITDDFLKNAKTLGFADEDTGRKDSLATALNLYKSSKYRLSQTALIAYMEKYNEPLEDFEIAKFTYAASCAEVGNVKKAAQVYSELSSSSNNKIKDDARYYEAIYTYQFDQIASKGMLEEIAEDKSSSYFEIAKTFLDSFF